MLVYVSLLRAVNVSGHQQIKMDALRKLCLELGFERIQTYIQSGNIVFRSSQKGGVVVAKRLRESIEKTAGFAPDVIVRTQKELAAVVERNPFAGRADVSPAKLLVTFFDRDPDSEGVAKVNAMNITPEEFRVLGRELYVYYPEGMGRSKFPAAAINKALKVSGTARNWNTVLKLLDMAAEAETSG